MSGDSKVGARHKTPNENQGRVLASLSYEMEDINSLQCKPRLLALQPRQDDLQSRSGHARATTTQKILRLTDDSLSARTLLTLKTDNSYSIAQ